MVNNCPWILDLDSYCTINSNQAVGDKTIHNSKLFITNSVEVGQNRLQQSLSFILFMPDLHDITHNRRKTSRTYEVGTTGGRNYARTLNELPFTFNCQRPLKISVI